MPGICGEKDIMCFTRLAMMRWECPPKMLLSNTRFTRKKWTLKCINMMKDQQLRIGFSYDWYHTVSTYNPEYYKWNQWIFIQFFKNGLAYKKKAAINWCESCGTVLANEQVIDGRCWRCDTIVVDRELEQWFFNIRKYADELLESLDELEFWPEQVKAMQRNWIGKSYGTGIKFPVAGSNVTIQAFTTRPDTLFGVTYLVMAPEHPLIPELIADVPEKNSVLSFIERTKRKTRTDRVAENREKEGVFIGRSIVHPLTDEEFPIFIADYALMDYGTGAVMAVPAHDQRDFEFAKKYSLPIKFVITPDADNPLIEEQMKEAFIGEGYLVNSGDFNGAPNIEAKKAITRKLKEKDLGDYSVHVPASRLADLPPKILGHTDSCCLLQNMWHGAGSRVGPSCASSRRCGIHRGRKSSRNLKKFFGSTLSKL